MHKYWNSGTDALNTKYDEWREPTHTHKEPEKYSRFNQASVTQNKEHSISTLNILIVITVIETCFPAYRESQLHCMCNSHANCRPARQIKKTHLSLFENLKYAWYLSPTQGQYQHNMTLLCNETTTVGHSIFDDCSLWHSALGSNAPHVSLP